MQVGDLRLLVSNLGHPRWLSLPSPQSFSFSLTLSSLASFKKKKIVALLKNHQQQAGVEKDTSFPGSLCPNSEMALLPPKHRDKEMNDQGDPGVYYLTSLVTTD